jgi:beta-mannosidase
MLTLNGTWKMRGFEPGEGAAAGAQRPDLRDRDWVPVAVPGDVHRALVAAGQLPEPFDGMNVEDCQWVENKEWWYRLTFDCPREVAGPAELVFEGLDTYATVWLNGVQVGEAANMLIPHTFDCGQALRPGKKNVVAVRCDPTVPTVEKRPADKLWAAFYSHRPWVRKAQMNFGWDWGPRLVTVGIWRGVSLREKRSPRLVSPYVRCHALSEEGAVVVLGTELEGEPTEGLRLRVTLEDGERSFGGSAEVVGERAETRLLVPQPRLWWPHTHGRPALHTAQFELLRGEEVLDQATVRTGLRTIEVVRKPDPEGPGKSFTVHVNGVPVFCQGADWIPVDSFIGSAPRERYRRLVEMAKDAHMNMLRVWGGGVYEDDAFYEACDELGVMVWQDFMFSCAGYPDDDADFRQAVEVEADVVVRRLRTHPCLALWCGNNENDWIDDMRHPTAPGQPFYGRRIYHEILPAVCARLDPTRLYWPSSPYGGNDHNSELEGDRHNWQVWAGMGLPRRFGQELPGGTTPESVSFRLYARDHCRFCSEFGIHASPPLRTLSRHIPAEELSYDSEQFLYRIKDFDRERKDRMMAAHSGLPSDLEDYVIRSMLTQAEGLRFGIEHYRRNRPTCGGALFWQLNDCWPGISWSVIDYYLNPKAGYYYAKRAMAPVILSPEIVAGDVRVWGVNDTLKSWVGAVHLRNLDVRGTVRNRRSVQAQIPANGVALIASWPLSEVATVAGREPGCFLISGPTGSDIPESVIFPLELKDMPFRPAVLTTEWKALDATTYQVTISSDVLAYFTHLVFPVDGVEASENYVPVIPSQPAVIVVRSPEPLSPDEVQVKSFNPTPPREDAKDDGYYRDPAGRPKRRRRRRRAGGPAAT